jgi:predicted metalloprotease with PDZ domain
LVTDASLATFLNHAKYPGRVNNSIDYYDKGMLIAFAIDVHLRQTHQGQSLDTAFHDFYLQFFGNGSTVAPDYVGYSTQQVIEFFSNINSELGKRIEAWLNEPAGLDTLTYLSLLGFEAIPQDTHVLGIFFMDDGAPEIYGVADNMPPALGLAPGDVITAINGFAYSLSALKWAAAAQNPVTLTVTRGHRILNFTMTPTYVQRISSLKWTGTIEQANLIKMWLGADFDPAPGQHFRVEFYENFHGIEGMI